MPPGEYVDAGQSRCKREVRIETPIIYQLCLERCLHIEYSRHFGGSVQEDWNVVATELHMERNIGIKVVKTRGCTL